MARKVRRMIYRGAAGIHVGGEMTPLELERRIQFLSVRNRRDAAKPRNVKRMTLYKSLLAAL